jgi:hypothetical protein
MKFSTISRGEQRLNRGFHSVPTEEHRLPLVSETHSADYPGPQYKGQKGEAEAMRTFHAYSHPRKKPLTFGDFVAGVYQTWGQRRAKGIIDLAIKVHVIEFRGTERFMIS